MGKRILFVPAKPIYSEYYEELLHDFSKHKNNIIAKHGVINPLNKKQFKPKIYSIENKKPTVKRDKPVRKKKTPLFYKNTMRFIQNV